MFRPTKVQKLITSSKLSFLTPFLCSFAWTWKFTSHFTLSFHLKLVFFIKDVVIKLEVAKEFSNKPFDFVFVSFGFLPCFLFSNNGLSKIVSTNMVFFIFGIFININVIILQWLFITLTLWYLTWINKDWCFETFVVVHCLFHLDLS